MATDQGIHIYPHLRYSHPGTHIYPHLRYSHQDTHIEYLLTNRQFFQVQNIIIWYPLCQCSKLLLVEDGWLVIGPVLEYLLRYHLL